VVALLGRGMSEVYRATDTRLGRDVALKVVGEALGTHGPALERFEREARLAASLSHPNVVALYDVGVHDGQPYFVTELLHGQTLRERLNVGAIPVPVALEWAVQTAQGLAAVHECGIVHRDLKPENLFITSMGQVKLLDFGIAKIVEAAREVSAPRGLTGGEPEPLVESAGGAHISLSPDHSRIMDVIGHRVLWVSPVAGTKPEKVYEFSDPTVRIDYPVWSPDGKWILFDRFLPQGGDVWMMESFED